LKLLRDIRIDLIISDWNMPVMDGEEFLYGKPSQGHF